MLTRIGNVEVWRILESVEAFMDPLEFFPDLGEDGLDLMRKVVPHQLCPDTGLLLLPIQGFLIKTSAHVILVDACAGNHKTFPFHENWNKRSDGRFMAGLVAAGITPEDVDFVLCTHLHVDHVGWNTRLENSRWVPTFPNARYLFPEKDNAHFSVDPGEVYTESVLPVIAAGQAELVGSDHMLGDHVSLLPTPGHTPGRKYCTRQPLSTPVPWHNPRTQCHVQVGRKLDKTCLAYQRILRSLWAQSGLWTPKRARCLVPWRRTTALNPKQPSADSTIIRPNQRIENSARSSSNKLI